MNNDDIFFFSQCHVFENFPWLSNPAVTNHVDINLFSLLVLFSATFQVLPNGNILDCLSSMRKDNTGLLGLSMSCVFFLPLSLVSLLLQARG